MDTRHVYIFCWFAAGNPKYIRDDVFDDNNQFKKLVLKARKAFPDLYNVRAFYAIYEGLKTINAAYRPSPENRTM